MGKAAHVGGAPACFILQNCRQSIILLKSSLAIRPLLYWDFNLVFVPDDTREKERDRTVN